MLLHGCRSRDDESSLSQQTIQFRWMDSCPTGQHGRIPPRFNAQRGALVNGFGGASRLRPPVELPWMT